MSERYEETSKKEDYDESAPSAKGCVSSAFIARDDERGNIRGVQYRSNGLKHAGLRANV